VSQASAADLIHTENCSITLGLPFWRAIFYPIFPDSDRPAIAVEGMLRLRVGVIGKTLNAGNATVTLMTTLDAREIFQHAAAQD